MTYLPCFARGLPLPDGVFADISASRVRLPPAAVSLELRRSLDGGFPESADENEADPRYSRQDPD